MLEHPFLTAIGQPVMIIALASAIFYGAVNIGSINTDISNIKINQVQQFELIQQIQQELIKHA